MKITNKKYAHPYWKWEDYLNHMYDDDIRLDKVKGVIKILGNKKQCERTMKRVLTEWKYAPETNLLSDVTFQYVSDRAWLGAACCNIEIKATVSEVRNGWWRLTDEQRDAANMIADRLIEEYRNQFFDHQLSLF